MSESLSVSSLLARAAAAGLDLLADGPELDQTGLDFAVLHAHDESGAAWILRAPRRVEAYASTHVEKRALDVIRPFLKAAVPDFVVHGEELIAYPKLEGTMAMSLLPADPKPRFLDSFAETLVALQRVSIADLAAAGVPVRTIDAERAALERTMHETRAALEPPRARWERWMRWLHDDTMWPEHVALVHGDLHPGHLLLGPTGIVWGILDWTEVAVSDPSIDLSVFYGCYGQAAFEQLLARFAAAGGVTWPRLAEHAQERWLAFPALAAQWATKHDNAQVLAFARAEVRGASPDAPDRADA